jgi:hypothetical protein
MLNPTTARHLQGALFLAGAAGFVQLILGSAASAALAILTSLALYFASLAVHEAAHWLAARRLSARPRFSHWSVTSRPAGRTDAVMISLAGPLAGALLPLLLLSVQPPPAWALIGLLLAANHLAMLLPVFPDGRLILQNLSKDPTHE